MRDLRERGWRGGILMTWMNEKPKASQWLGLWVVGFRPRSQPLRVLGSASAVRGRSRRGSGRTPCFLGFSWGLQRASPALSQSLRYQSSVSLETHSAMVFQGEPCNKQGWRLYTQRMRRKGSGIRMTLFPTLILSSCAVPGKQLNLSVP